jgi:hypothetical protein
MNTDPRGAADAAGAADELHERLTRRFDAELTRAKLDYPSLARRAPAESTARPAPTRLWPRLASAVAAAGVLAIVGLVGLGLWSSPSPATGPSGSLPSQPGTTIPTEIDGQHVWSMAASAEWEKLAGSFLLAVYAVDAPIPCPSPLRTPASSAEVALVPECGVVSLVPRAADNTDFFYTVAPRGRDLLDAWLNGPEVVIRAHTNDPEAAQCGPDFQAQCQSALVVEAIVWPDIPAQIDGEKVYRAADRASFPASGSFLLGGRVNKPDVVPPCPAPIDRTQAELQLIPYCSWVSIDGLQVAPKSNINEPKNELVVARVHVDDPLAAECPATVAEQCKGAIVVESTVWTSDALVGRTPSAAPTVEPSLNPASSAQSVGPVPSGGAIVPAPTAETSPATTPGIGPDGVPTTFFGGTVYRAANLPPDQTFMLGGVLGRDASCAAPTGMSAKPPACGYWTVDGIAVGNMVEIPDALIGSAVVVQIDRSQALVICKGVGPCPLANLLVVTDILWSGPTTGAATPPPPTLG